MRSCIASLFPFISVHWNQQSQSSIVPLMYFKWAELCLMQAMRLPENLYVTASSPYIQVRQQPACWNSLRRKHFKNTRVTIQDVPGGKFHILGGHSIGHSKQMCICTCVLFRTVSEIEPFHCAHEQRAMSSQELQSALMLTVEFSKMYYTR
jgi:hypothetical protein